MKLLTISNNCLSKINSSGRTMLNLLACIDKNDIMSLFFNGYGISENQIPNSYYISNMDAVKSHLKFGHHKIKSIAGNLNDLQLKYRKKTAFKVLARSMIFSSSFSIPKEIKNKIKKFDCDAVVLYLAELPAQIKIARKIAKKLKKPLVVFTGEDYPLKDHDYLKQKDKNTFFSKILISKLKRQAKKSLRECSLSIFTTESLLADYQNHMVVNNPHVIPTLSDIPYSEEKKPGKITNLLYAGNLGIGRDESLVRLAASLFVIDPEAKIHVYSSSHSDLLNGVKNIVFHETVSYDELIEIEKKADMLLHIESFEPYWIKDLKHALSTKIADVLLSGKPFFVFGPLGIDGIDYLHKIAPKFVATNPGDLKEKLEAVMKGKETFKIVKENEVLKKFSVQENICRIRQLFAEITK